MPRAKGSKNKIKEPPVAVTVTGTDHPISVIAKIPKEVEELQKDTVSLIRPHVKLPVIPTIPEPAKIKFSVDIRVDGNTGDRIYKIKIGHFIYESRISGEPNIYWLKQFVIDAANQFEEVIV